jgi:hypothetical protein
MVSDIDFNYLIDIQSTKEEEAKDFESLKDIIKEEYLFFSKYLNDLYFVEANIVYMNYVANVPQVKIAEIFNIKQYGVSKRISSALKRLSIQLKAPDSQVKDSYIFLNKLISHPKSYVIVIWYALKTISAVALSARASNSIISQTISETKKTLKDYAECNNVHEFVKVMALNKRVEELDEDFIESLHNDYSFFLVVRHKIKSHIKYIEELQSYNSRGSHNFRKDWH